MPLTLVALPATALGLAPVHGGDDAGVTELRAAVAAALTAPDPHPGTDLGSAPAVEAVRDAGPVARSAAGRSPIVVALACDPAGDSGADDTAGDGAGAGPGADPRADPGADRLADRAAGPGTGVVLDPPRGEVHLGGLGLPALRTDVGPASGPLADALEVRAVHPGPDLAVLALHARRTTDGAAAPAITLLGLPTVLDDQRAEDLARLLADLATGRDAGPVVVVCAADLAAGHGPKPPRPDVGADASADFDARVLAAVGAGDVRALDDLAARSADVAARGLAGLQVAVRMAVTAGLLPSAPCLTVVDGVGGLACRWVQASPDR